MGKTDRLSRQIHRLVSEIVLYELNDPRIHFITVTKIKLSEDFCYCKIFISILGTPAQQRTTMRALQDARGYIQKTLASRLSLRTAPILTIEQDTSIEKSFEMFKRLEEDRQKGNKDQALDQVDDDEHVQTEDDKHDLGDKHDLDDEDDERDLDEDDEDLDKDDRDDLDKDDKDDLDEGDRDDLDEGDRDDLDEGDRDDLVEDDEDKKDKFI